MVKPCVRANSADAGTYSFLLLSSTPFHPTHDKNYRFQFCRNSQN
ncbi:hypothetical protein CKA32_000954 [Geitlerinema sp. FC II]|nr:hypothetical protein CKA32_000954 [Geitlerinema sp. FC II]